jgi:hypothetical protein
MTEVGTVVHTCNPRTQEVRQGGWEFKVSLYIARPCLNKTRTKRLHPF